MCPAPSVLPETAGAAGDVLVREWQVSDAEALAEAITVSHEHLRPWMAFASEPAPPIEQRREWLAGWRERRLAGGDAVYGMFVDGAAAGSCGLHRRIGPSGLEIGYWVHVDHSGKGLATTVSRILTDAAFTLPEIDHVEIHHDKANVRSGRVPQKLGYTLVSEQPDPVTAPAETGISCCWRVTREQWCSDR